MSTVDREPEWLTVAEYARHFRITPRTATRWVAEGHIRVRRIGPSGRSIRIHRSELSRNIDIPAAS